MPRPVSRRAYLAAMGAAALAGCLGGGRPDGAGRQLTESSDTRTASPTGRSVAADGAGPPTAADRLSLPMAPAAIGDAAVSGGPPKDGIPAIDRPSFESADEAGEWLDPADPVFGLVVGDVAKAYPQSILVWHEICNDVVDGMPVSVTYCPLTGTAMGFERGGTTFGVSGRLVHNNLVMYDRATETWWPQVLATAVPGPWNTDPPVRSLREFRLVWTTWERWRARHPDTAVLSRDTGYARNYDRDPYGTYTPLGGYYAPEAAPLFDTLRDDDRLPPKQVVIGTRTGDGAAAVVKDRLREAKIVDGELGGTPVVAAYEPSLDTGYFYVNPAGVDPEYRDGKVVAPDGSVHAADSLPLEPVLAFDAMWFAWSGFYPDTTLYA